MTESKAKKIVLTLASIATAFVFSLVLFITTADEVPSINTGGEDGRIGGEFTLTSIDGDVSLSDFRGQVVVIYFGFVQCTQVCPVSMRTIKTALDKLSPEQAKQVQMLFVSVDVDNDGYREVDEYAKQFSSDFMGLTGTLDQINHVIDEYGAYYSPTEAIESDPGQAYRHTSRYYIVNKEGELIDAMRHSTTSNEIAARLRQLI